VNPERDVVSFPTWKSALASAALSAASQAAYRREILAFLHHCKIEHAPATVMLAKEYLAKKERRGANGTRPALRWFFQAARGQRRSEGLLGHESVETTQIYTHVMQKPGLGVRSPLDSA
jgi:integrase